MAASGKNTAAADTKDVKAAEAKPLTNEQFLAVIKKASNLGAAVVIMDDRLKFLKDELGKNPTDEKQKLSPSQIQIYGAEQKELLEKKAIVAPAYQKELDLLCQKENLAMTNAFLSHMQDFGRQILFELGIKVIDAVKSKIENFTRYEDFGIDELHGRTINALWIKSVFEEESARDKPLKIYNEYVKAKGFYDSVLLDPSGRTGNRNLLEKLISHVSNVKETTQTKFFGTLFSDPLDTLKIKLKSEMLSGKYLPKPELAATATAAAKIPTNK